MMAKLKIGITGNIGSGKSTFCNFVKIKNFNIVDADSEAKNILAEDVNVKTQIIKLFGEESYIDGNPNIDFLAKNIFVSPENVKKINSIVHPATINRINEKMNQILECSELVFVESALIFEANIDDIFDYIILISASDENKIIRVKERDNIDDEEIKRRLDNQMSEAFKKQNSDFVIENNSSFDEFKIKSELILNTIVALTFCNNNNELEIE